MRNSPIWLSLVLAAVLLASVVCVSVSHAKSPREATSPEEVEFSLRERSVFDIAKGAYQHELTRGARAVRQDQPFAAVQAYPTLRSKKPIYGLVWLAPEANQRESGIPLYFVVDESGEARPAPAAAKQESSGGESLLERLGARLFGSGDEPQAAKLPPLKNTYDRLYVDLNGDLDLTNDPVVVPMQAPPAGSEHRYQGLVQSVVFEECSVPLDFGAELGQRPVRLVPRLSIQEYEGREYAGVEFIAAVAREGEIRIGSRAYHAVLAQSYVISGRYDAPFTQLLLTSRDNPSEREHWWGADQLNAMRLVDGQYYTTSTTPLGDRLIVNLYQGEFGILKIGPGDRSLDRISIRGSLDSPTTSLAVGEVGDDSSATAKSVAEYRLPVGDYIPNYVTIGYGRLQLSISQNYHSDGKPRQIDRSAWIYGIRIRKDEPFVWDFSTPPEVMFASPARDQTYRPGEEISVMAVLTDPKLTIMIRGLVDTERKETKTYDMGDGRTASYEANVSLDPTVTITNAAGEQVAQGVMPFG
jgi:hypothetical protein